MESFAPRISKPFDTLPELYNAVELGLIEVPAAELRESIDFMFKGLELSTNTLPLVRINEAPKTLLCHDMKGGYLEDRFFNGSTCHDSYVFYHWNAIDIFVYFSHHFVTIPPAGWIATAHRHAVKVLGTVITEGDNDTWNVILESQESVRRFAESLILVARCYRFDGWLLNVESKIKREQVVHLIYFVRYLTDRIHSELVGSQIIWYDSVTNTGELKWQNALNENNQEYFLACDGIFLNYNWTEKQLDESRDFALDLNAEITNIYVGVDVWGRGCPGGGGLNCAYAMNLIRNGGLSAAIFAPGWTHEYFGPNTFRILEDLFWAQLYPYLYVHLPIYDDETFRTTFCRGAGTKFFSNGRLVSDMGIMRALNGDDTGEKTSFYNLGYQETQVSVPVPYLRFTRFSKRVIADNTRDGNNGTTEGSNANHDNGDDKDKVAKSQVEYIYENKGSIVRVCNNVISFENKLPTPNVNTYEYCDEFSFSGGGCLKLITRDLRIYHRLLFIFFYLRNTYIQATVTYHFQDNTEASRTTPILILSHKKKLLSILPYEYTRIDNGWRECVYLTNLKNINEVGILFSRECVCYIGRIMLQKIEDRFNNCDPVFVASRSNEYHGAETVTDWMQQPAIDLSS